MGLLSSNKTFYPTPSKLAGRMVGKIKGEPRKVLEPSAGKGDLIECIGKRYGGSRMHISAIEINEELQATLRGNRIKVIDSDFLTFSGPDKFDLIIANPPFDEGDRHLLKAIEIMYRGQIIFLLNAETIKNPHTNTRKELVKKLGDLDAQIEYIQDAFLDAERKTAVEVALVNIIIERNVEDDLFADAKYTAAPVRPTIEDKNELTTGRNVEDLVAEYNEVVRVGVEMIAGYFRNYKKIGAYIGLNDEAGKYHPAKDSDMTSKMQAQVNQLLAAVRTSFWRRTLNLSEVQKRLTKKKRAEFEEQIKQRCDMDFTASNIRQFVLNLLGSREKTLTDAVIDIFDMFTKRHCWSDGLYDENIHYFNGWKTNKAFRVNKRVVIPIHGSYGHPFVSYNGLWKLNHGAAETLHDIDIVMNYFDGMQGYVSMAKAIEESFERRQTSKIRSTYFTITVYKKGTAHMTFNDPDILRRFNVVACKGKEWLPHDYGTKQYDAMDTEEKAVVEEFEGALSYAANADRPLFAMHANLLRLTAA
jgi:hypothetical protein